MVFGWNCWSSSWRMRSDRLFADSRSHLGLADSAHPSQDPSAWSLNGIERTPTQSRHRILSDSKATWSPLNCSCHALNAADKLDASAFRVLSCAAAMKLSTVDPFTCPGWTMMRCTLAVDLDHMLKSDSDLKSVLLHHIASEPISEFTKPKGNIWCFLKKIRSLEHKVDSFPFEFFASFHHRPQVGIEQPKLIASQGYPIDAANSANKPMISGGSTAMDMLWLAIVLKGTMIDYKLFSLEHREWVKISIIVDTLVLTMLFRRRFWKPNQKITEIEGFNHFFLIFDFGLEIKTMPEMLGKMTPFSKTPSQISWNRFVPPHDWFFCPGFGASQLHDWNCDGVSRKPIKLGCLKSAWANQSNLDFWNWREPTNQTWMI